MLIESFYWGKRDGGGVEEYPAMANNVCDQASSWVMNGAV